MPVATRKSKSELKKMARQRAKRKFKVKDPKRSRAMKKAWASKRSKMLKGVKTRKRLYQSIENFMDTFMEVLGNFSTEYNWSDVSETEEEIQFESESGVIISLKLTEEEKLSIEVLSAEDKVLETFTIGLEHSESILKGVFQAYSDNIEDDKEE